MTSHTSEDLEEGNQEALLDDGSNSGDADGEGLPLLPKHTIVVVTGNNRTKKTLVGQRGVVRKAVGLGGWHWLQLDTGERIRLQRNAIRVLQAPTGDEKDFSDMEEEDGADQAHDSLPRVRARRPARPVAHSPDIPSQRRASTRQLSAPRINFKELTFASLKRYRSTYNLSQVGPNPTKDQLVAAVAHHFMSQTVDEGQVLKMFLAAARRSAQQASMGSSQRI